MMMKRNAAVGFIIFNSLQTVYTLCVHTGLGHTGPIIPPSSNTQTHRSLFLLIYTLAADVLHVPSWF